MNTETAESKVVLRAFHSDPSRKAKYMERVRVHRELDQIVQRLGFSNGKGCAIGCTLDNYDHSRYPAELGIPEVLGKLEDQLFELIPAADKGTWQVWPERFLAAIEPGTDLSGVWTKWTIWMLVDSTHGVIRHAKNFPDVEAAILRVAELHRTGGTPAQWAAAAGAAWAARAAKEEAWAARAAAVAAVAAAWATEEEAAVAVVAARAWAGASATWGTAARDKLVELLGTAPIAAI